MVERNKIKTKNKTNLVGATAIGDMPDDDGVVSMLVETADIDPTANVAPASDVTSDTNVTAASEITSDAQDVVPECIDDRFDVLEVLGKGGMGTVFKVRDRQTGTVFALKLLHQKLQSDPSALKRFEQEAKAAEQLDHPNLVPTYSHGVTKNGEPYLLIEYVQGKTLAQIIEREGALDEDRAIALFQQVCNALSYAHENHIVHRDIKPANLLVSKSPSGGETVRIVDFGIAKTLTEVDRSTRNLTQTNEIFGSPHYMSPEQCLGLMLDEKSDIYSLGCVIYEALSGKPPFAGSNPIQLVVKHINDRPRPYLPKFSATRKQQGLQSIALRCIEKDTDDRFQDVGEIENALERLRSGKSVGFDQNLKFKTSMFQKQLHTAAFALPLLLIGLYPFIFSIISPNAADVAASHEPKNVLADLVSWLLGFSVLPTVLTTIFAMLARSCFKVAREHLATQRFWWTTFSLTLSSVMCAGAVPTFLFLGYAAYYSRCGAVWNPLPSIDLAVIPGFAISFACAVGVMVCSIGFLLDGGPKKIELRKMLLRAGRPMALALAVVGIFAGCNFPGIVRKMSDIYFWIPKYICSDLRPKTVFLARQISPGDLGMLSNSAHVAAQVKNYPQAISDYTELMLLEKDKTGFRYKGYLVERAKLYTINLQYDKAINDWTEAIKLDPDSNYNYRMRGNCLFAQGKLSEALLDYDASLLRNYTDAMSYYKKASAQIALNDLDGALKTLDQRAKLYNGLRPALYLYRGYISGLQGDEDAAAANYRAAINASPRDPSEWDDVARATANLQLGDKPNALNSLEKAKEKGLTLDRFMSEETNMTNDLRKTLVQFVLKHNVYPAERWQEVRFGKADF